MTSQSFRDKCAETGHLPYRYITTMSLMCGTCKVCIRRLTNEDKERIAKASAVSESPDKSLLLFYGTKKPSPR